MRARYFPDARRATARLLVRALAVTCSILLSVVSFNCFAEAQQIKKVGVILQGGPWYSVVEGLRDGLNNQGLAEGKTYALDVRDTRGDLQKAEEAAKDLERQKVDLIYTAATSITLAAKRSTATTPIVFFAGTDPVAVKLVESIPRPGGRLTGVHTPITVVTSKRVELLREIAPNIRRVVTFYNPANAAAVESVKEAKSATQRLGLELVERQVSSNEELQKALQAFKSSDADAYLAASDAMLDSQAQAVVAMLNSTKLPSMFYLQQVVADGGLASYSPDFLEGGRQSATYVRKILEGVKPADLPVEQLDKLILIINLKTARQIGLSIQESILIRADKVIE